jgi:HEPN domain-containing protein
LNERHDEAVRWFRFAEEDVAAASDLVERRRWRQACYLAQQAAEKALKALLVERDTEPPRTHALNALRALLPEERTAAKLGDLSELGGWATASRYPGDWPEATEADAGRAVSDARAVLEAVRIDLDLRVA